MQLWLDFVCMIVLLTFLTILRFILCTVSNGCGCQLFNKPRLIDCVPSVLWRSITHACMHACLWLIDWLTFIFVYCSHGTWPICKQSSLCHFVSQLQRHHLHCSLQWFRGDWRLKTHLLNCRWKYTPGLRTCCQPNPAAIDTHTTV